MVDSRHNIALSRHSREKADADTRPASGAVKNYIVTCFSDEPVATTGYHIAIRQVATNCLIA
ncbi:hypothetical protein FDX20_01990 [Citrobacter sp. TBCS-11]|nr:hypothetical protein FDX20_01990 [Citrobacter sp. TBCS-11]